MNKSFARRIGKSLSKLQLGLLDSELPKYTLDPSAIPSASKYVAEIGIGMGDHFVTRAIEDSHALHIGFEPYLNGIANSLKLALAHDVTNIMLWPDDVDLLFGKLPDAFLDELYILFPDPWPKLKQKKRRIVNKERLKIFASKVKDGAIMHFGSDIDDYFDSVCELIGASGDFEPVTAGYNTPDGYTKTRYHLKAENEGRRPRFLQAKRIS
jgi:release factor glutamine methyltransferase